MNILDKTLQLFKKYCNGLGKDDYYDNYEHNIDEFLIRAFTYEYEAKEFLSTSPMEAIVCFLKFWSNAEVNVAELLEIVTKGNSYNHEIVAQQIAAVVINENKEKFKSVLEKAKENCK